MVNLAGKWIGLDAYRRPVLASGFVFAAGFEAYSLLGGYPYSLLSWRRQTPRRLLAWSGHGPTGGLLWGLDAGTPLSTYRTSSFGVVLIAGAATGAFGYPMILAGVAVGLGFVLPFIRASMFNGTHIPNGLRLLHALRHYVTGLRLAISVVALAATVASCVGQA